jgi:glycosyltransferase involved in cell wall biosynthesis
VSRIVVLHGSNDLYGASRVLLGDVSALVASGRSVEVVLPGAGPLSARMRAAGATVAETELTVLRRVDPRSLVRPPRGFPVTVRRDDVVVLWTLALAPYLPVVAFRRQSAILSVHEILDGVAGNALARAVARAGLPTMANSGATAAWLARNRFAPGSLVVAYPATRPQVVARRRDATAAGLHALIAGRINGFKGQEDVIQAIDALRGEGHDVRLTIAGGPFHGQERHAAALRSACAGRPWADYVGERDDVGSLLDAADVLVMATRRPEPFGLVALEAWSAGRRCLVPREGGAAEAAALADGLTFNPRDVSSLTAGLRRLVHDPALLDPPAADAPAAFLCTAAQRLGAWEELLTRAARR